MSTLGPEFHVLGILETLEPFARLGVHSAAVARRAVVLSYSAGDIVPEEVLQAQGLCVVAAGSLLLSVGGEERCIPVSTGARVFCPPCAPERVQFVAASNVTVLWWRLSDLDVVWHDAAARELILGGMIQPHEKLLACLACGGVFDAANERAVAAIWPRDAGRLTQPDSAFMWVNIFTDTQAAGTRWRREGTSKWCRVAGIPLEAIPESEPKPSVAKERGSLQVPRREPLVQPIEITMPAQPDEVDGASAPGPVALPSPPQPPHGSPTSQTGPGRIFLRRAFQVVAACVAVGAFVAWRTPIRERMVFHGSLVFTGRVQDLKTEVAGELVELRFHPGARLEAGTPVAIIQPGLDTARLKDLADTALAARARAGEAVRVLASSGADISKLSAPLAGLAVERERILGDVRIYKAAQRGTWIPDEKSTHAEYRRFLALLPPNEGGTRAVPPAVDDTVHDDRAVKREDLALAEQEYRDALEQLRIQESVVREFMAADKDDKKGADDLISAQRALSKLQAVADGKLRNVQAMKRAVNAVARYAAADRTTAVPPVEPLEVIAEEPQAPDVDALMLSAKLALAECDARIRAVEARYIKEAVNAETEATRLREAAKPRPVLSRFSGTATAGSLVAVGGPVAAGTRLGGVITEYRWKADFVLPSVAARELSIGSAVLLVVSEPACQFHATLAAPPGVDGVVSFQLPTGRGDIQAGTSVRMEMVVTTGNLFTQFVQRYVFRRKSGTSI